MYRESLGFCAVTQIASINFANLLHDWQDDSECSIPSSKIPCFGRGAKLPRTLCLPMKLEALTERIMRGDSSRMFVASGYHIHGKKTINAMYHPGGKVILDFWLTALL